MTEKGVTSLELRVDGRGGHASTPARNGPTVRLARAITRLDRHQMAASVPDPTVELLRRMAPHAPARLRPLMANAARLRPAAHPGPDRGRPGDGGDDAHDVRGHHALRVARAQRDRQHRQGRRQHPDHGRRHRRRACSSTSAGRSTTTRCRSPSSRRTSPARSRRCDDAFALIESTITEVFPDAVPAPYVMMAATDSRFFTRICSRVYRFAPFRMTKAQRESIHSYDEHLGVDALVEGVRWYQRLIERLPGMTTHLRPAGARPGRDRRLPGLRRAGQRRPAGLLHADLQRHRRPPRHQRRRRQLVRGRAADRLGAGHPAARPPRRPGRPQEGAAALDRGHRARLVGDGVRAGLHDVPDRLRAPGCVRRLAAARGRDHLPAYGRHRPAEPAHPPGRRRSWSARSSWP